MAATEVRASHKSPKYCSGFFCSCSSLLPLIPVLSVFPSSLALGRKSCKLSGFTLLPVLLLLGKSMWIHLDYATCVLTCWWEEYKVGSQRDRQLYKPVYLRQAEPWLCGGRQEDWLGRHKSLIYKAGFFLTCWNTWRTDIHLEKGSYCLMRLEQGLEKYSRYHG